MPAPKSKNIVITGGARGLGRCTARHLLSLSCSHKIFIVDFDANELDYTVTHHLAAYAPRVSSSVTNLRDPDAIRAAVAQAAAFFGGRIDVLINNAGVARGFFNAGTGTMEDVATGAQWEEYIATNLSAPFYMSQAVIPWMKSADAQKEDGSAGVDRTKDLKRTDEFNQLPLTLHGEDKLDEGGCIINVSSFRAHQSDPDCEGYAASKGGVLALTQAMAVSCQRWGIRVVAISPGWVSVQHECRSRDEKTRETQNEAYKEVAPHEEEAVKLRMKAWAEDLEELHHKQHPAGRVGRGEDLAEMVEYVMGAGFLSGQELVLDGGANRRKNPNV
ncbi:oxidoreductase domain-containing protein [Clathrospora elynae]|uniref:Oxidoreductase domain-containing protein n=1 Tax=Clathrospora elynae TaxID=706981 RepID=A0A6A5SSX5_9PLEO|nr:oxidoreductase domain-containing protein [Clathrospora elynae]